MCLLAFGSVRSTCDNFYTKFLFGDIEMKHSFQLKIKKFCRLRKWNLTKPQASICH